MVSLLLGMEAILTGSQLILFVQLTAKALHSFTLTPPKAGLPTPVLTHLPSVHIQPAIYWLLVVVAALVGKQVLGMAAAAARAGC
jgi:hypothetical protein